MSKNSEAAPFVQAARPFTVGDLRAALVGIPDENFVMVDDVFVDTNGAERDYYLTVRNVRVSAPYALGSLSGPICQDLILVVQDADVAAIGKSLQ